MNRTKKIWLGILAFAPIILGLIALVYMFVSFIPHMHQLEQLEDDPHPIHILSQMAPFFFMIIISLALHVGLLIYFIIHLINNKTIKSEERLIWILVFLLAGSIAFPVYWIIRIWPGPKPESNFIRE
ncbi:MAG: hypothetical protein KGZ74_03505 [Chitinophagaceae bacterium]|nr:hypothetical protein [Chitinophagaceae bacterium]